MHRRVGGWQGIGSQTAQMDIYKQLTGLDFVVMAGICWGFALTLAARSWVKLNEPKLLALRREQVQAQARRQAEEIEFTHEHNMEAAAGGDEPPPAKAAEAEGS